MKSITSESNFKINKDFIVLKFGATWCGPCKQINSLLEKLEKEFPTINFMSIDIEDVPEITKKFKIKSLPTLVLLKEGKEINRINGLVLINSLRKAFNDLIKEN